MAKMKVKIQQYYNGWINNYNIDNKVKNKNKQEKIFRYIKDLSVEEVKDWKNKDGSFGIV